MLLSMEAWRHGEGGPYGLAAWIYENQDWMHWQDFLAPTEVDPQTTVPSRASIALYTCDRIH